MEPIENLLEEMRYGGCEKTEFETAIEQIAESLSAAKALYDAVDEHMSCLSDADLGHAALSDLDPRGGGGSDVRRILLPGSPF